MGTTPIYALRYPEAADPADVPTDIHELATDVETVISTGAHSAELAYSEITSNLSVTIASTEASPLDIVSAATISLPASTIILIEFYATYVQPGAATNALLGFNIWDGTDIGRLAVISNPAAATLYLPIHGKRRLTATTGSHTYKIRAWAAGGSGGVFAAPPSVPTHIRITRA